MDIRRGQQRIEVGHKIRPGDVPRIAWIQLLEPIIGKGGPLLQADGIITILVRCFDEPGS